MHRYLDCVYCLSLCRDNTQNLHSSTVGRIPRQCPQPRPKVNVLATHPTHVFQQEYELSTQSDRIKEITWVSIKCWQILCHTAPAQYSWFHSPTNCLTNNPQHFFLWKFINISALWFLIFKCLIIWAAMGGNSPPILFWETTNYHVASTDFFIKKASVIL